MTLAVSPDVALALRDAAGKPPEPLPRGARYRWLAVDGERVLFEHLVEVDEGAREDTVRRA